MSKRDIEILRDLEGRFKRTFSTPLRSKVTGIWGQSHILIDRRQARAIGAALREIEAARSTGYDR